MLKRMKQCIARCTPKDDESRFTRASVNVSFIVLLSGAIAVSREAHVGTSAAPNAGEERGASEPLLATVAAYFAYTNGIA